MKQLTYTSCVARRSVNGRSGFQFRAASRGIDAQQLTAAERLVGYSLPEGMTACDEAVGTGPVRLALIDSPGLGRVLLHSVYAGREGDSDRQGNIFTHLLLELPPEFDAGQAIRTWGSQFWKRHDGDGPVELDDVRTLVPGPPDALDRRALRDGKVQGMLRFLLGALVLPVADDQRILLAAPAHEVAVCLAAAARVLPAWLLRGVTFSTYESSPLSSTARVVGTCWGNGAAKDLPANYYAAHWLVHNRYTGRASELPGPSHFAEFAFDKLLANKAKEVDQFLTHLGSCGVGGPGDENLLELGFCVDKDLCQELSAGQMSRLLRHEGLGPITMAKPSGLARVIELADSDAEFFLKTLPHALKWVEKKPAPRSAAGPVGGTGVRLEDWRDWVRYLRRPDLDPARLRRLVAVVLRAPAAARGPAAEELLRAAFGALLALKRPDVQDDVEVVLRVFEPAIGGGVAGVYRGLWERYLGRRDRQVVRPALILALASVGVGRWKDDALPTEVDTALVSDAQHFLRQLRGEPRRREIVRMMRRAARGWNSKEHSSRLPGFLRASLWRRLWWLWLLLAVASTAGAAAAAARTGKVRHWLGLPAMTRDAGDPGAQPR
jgi:hypothetical protein